MSDTDPSGKQPGVHDALGLELMRLQARIAKRRGFALNQALPTLSIDPVTGKYVYLSAPIPLKRLFGSPLAQNTKDAEGPNKERRVTDGWAKPRYAYKGDPPSARSHGGLDFRVAENELTLAAADGVVVFAGYQRRVGGRVQAPGAYQPNPKSGDLVIPNGSPSAFRGSDLGHGGLYVSIRHNGDFEGYTTEYMHLSKVLVKKGDIVRQGNAVGVVGTTGGRTGVVSRHLHFQILFGPRIAVNPSQLVPNYYPGESGVDSTTSHLPPGVLATLVANAPVGLQRALAKHAGTIAAIDRNLLLANQTHAYHHQQQAQFFVRLSDGLSVSTTQLYVAAAAFDGDPPVIDNPMTFDFTTGTWTDGKPV